MIDKTAAWYLAALKGERGPINQEEPMFGYYRTKNQDDTHSAIAYWYDQTAEGKPLRCHLDGKDIPIDRAIALWTFASKGLIPPAVYWKFIDDHVWSDIDPADMKRKAFVVSIDVGMVFEQFKDATDVLFLLKRIAQDAVNKGIDVPGATLEYRDVIKRGVISKKEKVA